jgi:phosphoesterase RecJ-like protein
MSAEGEAARRLKLFYDGRIASVTMPYSSCEALGLDSDSLETIIDIPRSVSGVDVAFVIKQVENTPVYRVSMRSACDVDVSLICKRFGGGGHVRASGCTVEARDIDEAERILVATVIEFMNK